MLFRGTVVIIGRPNVGKSTLFNKLVGARVSIIDPSAGVTRDRILHRIELGNGDEIDIIDTGGIGIVDAPEISEHVEKQIAMAMGAADVIIFLVDTKDGVTSLDEMIADKLRRLERPVVLAANKVDNAKLTQETAVFFKLGLGDSIPISGMHGYNVSDLMEAVAERLPAGRDLEEQGDIPKIAIVGRRNVGKSSLVNRLTQSERVVVSDLPGTTRDAIDVLLERKDRKALLIDTAGLRKRQQIDVPIEYYSEVRTERAISRCDAALLMLSAPDKIARIDKQIAAMITSEYKPCIIAVNKWDLVPENIGIEKFTQYVQTQFSFMRYAPLTFMSAKTGLNAWKTLELCLDLAAQAEVRVPTGALNKVVQDAQKRRTPRGRKSGTPKIYYATQTSVKPPTIVFFVNNVDFFGPNYTRYLANRLREELQFPEIPIRIIYRLRERERD